MSEKPKKSLMEQADAMDFSIGDADLGMGNGADLTIGSSADLAIGEADLSMGGADLSIGDLSLGQGQGQKKEKSISELAEEAGLNNW